MAVQCRTCSRSVCDIPTSLSTGGGTSQAQDSSDLCKASRTVMSGRHLSSQGWPGGLRGQGGVHRLQQLLEVLLTHGCCLSPVCSRLQQKGSPQLNTAGCWLYKLLIFFIYTFVLMSWGLIGGQTEYNDTRPSCSRVCLPYGWSQDRVCSCL